VLAVTADTNVYVSAFNYPGKPRELLSLADSGAIRLDVSEDIIRETRQVLIDKFGWSVEGADGAEAQMRRLGRIVSPTARVDAIQEDPADNRILECALSARSDYVATGDKDLLRLRVFRDIPIMRPADIVAIATAQRRER